MSQDADPLPADECAAGRLSDPARQVHRAVLAAFAATGQPPARADLDRLARCQAADPDRVLSELAAADLLAFTMHGEIRAAYPFSPTPTAIRVSWGGGPPAYAMCAIDALGISAMLGLPVTIAAAEPGTGRAITVAVDGDRALWTPRTTVVFAGTTGEQALPSADRCCGHISFFTAALTARAWASRHPEITGTILSRDGALRLAIDQFGAFLQPTGSDTAGAGPP
jgi:hypothetical protein